MTSSPRYTSHDGFLMPMGFPVEAFDSARRYEARPGDVFVATYPKCGTTWMQHVVWLLGHGGHPLAPDQRLTEVFPHLEEVGRNAVEGLPDPRLVKTHFPFGMTPFHPDAKYVYVARNPFDCLVSFFHHTRGFVRHYDFADGTVDDFFECFIAGRVDWGSYFEHLVGWAGQSHRDNVLFTTYEEMRAHPGRVEREVAEFLGGTFAAAAADPAVFSRVLEHSGFDRMKKDQARWSSARPDSAAPFVRKGTVGDWERHLTGDQARRLLEELERHVDGTPAADLWPEIRERARLHGS